MSFSKFGAPLFSAASRVDSSDHKTGRRPENSARSRSNARRTRTSLLPSLLCGALALALGGMSGCGDGGDSSASGGALIVPYLLGNNLKCAELNITNIQITLQNSSVEGPITLDAACDNTNKVLVQNIPVGQWTITVRAIDSMGVVTLDNINQVPLPVAEVLGADITSTAATISLSATPARVFLRWNTQYDNCAILNIDSFRVSAWDSTGATQFGTSSVGCREQESDANGFRRLPDPNRGFQGAQLNSLSVLPVNTTGAAEGSPVRFDLARPPGAGYSIYLSLICDKTQGCRKDGEAEVKAIPWQATKMDSTGTSTSPF